MANFNTVLETQQAIESTFMKKFSEFETRFNITDPKSSTTLSRLQEEFCDFRKNVSDLLGFLRQLITELAKTIDVAEMRHRRKFLLISGIPEELDSSLTEYLSKLFHEKLGLADLVGDAFKACHRLGSLVEGKCRPVLIRFSNPALRSAVWRKKAAFKGTPFVLSEFLTRQRQSLYILARKKLGMRNCWTMDGNIIAKLADGSRVRIYSEHDLMDMPGNSDLPDEEALTRPRTPSPAPAMHSRQYSKSRRVVKKK